jgi:AraC-like DNA-binding protein
MRARRKAASKRSKSRPTARRGPTVAAAPAPSAPSGVDVAGQAQAQPADPQWLVQVRTSYAVHNVVATRAELPFWLIRSDGKRQLEWMELGDPGNRPKPFHFEIYFGKESLRDEHYLEAIDEARKTKQVVVKELFGFADLLYALPADPEGRTFLHAGQFCCAQPDWESLSEQWRQLTGLKPASANTDFVEFVRMTLSLPVLPPELLGAMKQFVKLYAEYLGGSRSPALAARIDSVNGELISRLWPIENWIAMAIGLNKFVLPPWYHERDLTEWMKEGMGISRLPTVALALMPVANRAEAMDPVQTLVRNAQIQRACIELSREMPETGATRLGEYGVAILTSTHRGKSPSRARVELRERAEKFQAFLRDRFGVRALVGIGQFVQAGSPLHPSLRSAVQALHMCVQTEKDLLFCDDFPADKQLRYGDLQDAATALIAAADRENPAEMRLASDRYVRLVLGYADERIEFVRSLFLATLFQLFNRIERRYPMRTDARDQFIDDLTSKLEEAGTLYQVIECFGEALQRLCFVASKALHGPKVIRIEATLQYLRENFAEQLRLPEVARKAGFSVPAFARVFKEATGTSFLAYLRGLRVESAKTLLATTHMTIEQIAQSSGFQSQHHLIRSFKKVMAQTPGAYRHEHGLRQARR